MSVAQPPGGAISGTTLGAPTRSNTRRGRSGWSGWGSNQFSTPRYVQPDQRTQRLSPGEILASLVAAPPPVARQRRVSRAPPVQPNKTENEIAKQGRINARVKILRAGPTMAHAAHLRWEAAKPITGMKNARALAAARTAATARVIEASRAMEENVNENENEENENEENENGNENENENENEENDESFTSVLPEDTNLKSIRYMSGINYFGSNGYLKRYIYHISKAYDKFKNVRNENSPEKTKLFKLIRDGKSAYEEFIRLKRKSGELKAGEKLPTIKEVETWADKRENNKAARPRFQLATLLGSTGGTRKKKSKGPRGTHKKKSKGPRGTRKKKSKGQKI